MFDRFYGSVLAPKADRLGTYAAALAYCFVLSLIPFLLVTFTLGEEVTHLDLVQAYSDLLTDILPGETTPAPPPAHGETAESAAAAHREKSADLSQRILRTLQHSAHNGTVTGLSFLFALYTSFNLMTQIVRTLLFIFDDHRRPLVWTWRIGLKTLALFGIWMVVLLFIAICSVVTPVIAGVLKQAHLNAHLWEGPLLLGRNLIGVAALFAAFFLTYRLVPARTYSLAQVRDGSLIAVSGWVVFSLVFSYIMPSLWGTNAVYEALGSIVITLLWAQTCAWSVIAGACWMVRFPARRR